MQPKNQKISFISTVYNEEKKIKDFIKSILSQTVKPSEIILVDAGSTDKTVEIIRKFKSVTLKIKKGNRSKGRNEAIKIAKGNIIVVSDAGCILDKKWLENISKCFLDKNIEVVAGYYSSTGKSVLQKCIATYTSVMPDKLNELDFLPSSRSIGFRKYVWEKVNGYPENLDTCEDLVFAKNLKKAGLRFKTAKNAIVFWEQKNNLRSAFSQFLNYAKGDGKARYFRPQTPYLFLRYFFYTYLISLNFIIKSSSLKLTTIFIFILYILWAVTKNYKYVKNYKALYYLPALQFLSDLAVLLGTSFGFLLSLSLSEIRKILFNNKVLIVITSIYGLLLLYIINWGIPNLNHPFTYHMDEWHFFQSVRTFFKYGTGTMSGSANIPLYHIISSAVFLFPLYIFRLIDPFVATWSFDNLMVQQRLFEALRLHTLFYGVMTAIVIHKLIKEYVKFYPGLFTSFFLFSPIWLSLSNYYKYDIVLTFWIVVTLFFIFKFYKTKNNNNFIYAGITCGLSLATKFTAFPLFAAYVFSFFLFSGKKIYRNLLFGAGLVIFTFIFIGIPDAIFGKGNYSELLYSTLISSPKLSSNFIINSPSWIFLVVKQFPSIFGFFIYSIFIIGVLYLMIVIIKRIKDRKKFNYRYELFLLLSFLMFFIPSVLFGIDGGGNRVLILLPFIVIISSISLKQIFIKQGIFFKKIVLLIILLGLTSHVFQSYSWYVIKLSDPREISSEWMLKNLPKNSEIGVEEVPIYQMLPDVVLKEYYLEQQGNSQSITFKYFLVDEKIKLLPKYVIVTNDFDNLNYVNNSAKKKLVDRLKKDKYRKKIIFNANLKYYEYFSDKFFLVTTNIMPVPVTISIYEKINNF